MSALLLSNMYAMTLDITQSVENTENIESITAQLHTLFDKRRSARYHLPGFNSNPSNHLSEFYHEWDPVRELHSIKQQIAALKAQISPGQYAAIKSAYKKIQ